MKNLLGLIIENVELGDGNEVTRNLFNEYLGEKYKINSFSWKDVKDNYVLNFHNGAVDNFERDLKNYEIVYLNGLGKIELKKNELENFILNLGKLDNFVINDPKTMIENFDKKYLLNLQEKGVSVIPTVDVTSWDLEKINSFRFKGYSDALIKPRVFGERSRGIMKLNEFVFNENSFIAYKEIQGNELIMQPFIEDITKNGERSLIFVGDNFSHAIYRHRDVWFTNTTDISAPVVQPKKEELEVAEKVLSVWPTKYHITRFDFITEKNKPFISEVEMINPNLWLGEGKLEVDKNFMTLFKDYIKTK